MADDDSSDLEEKKRRRPCWREGVAGADAGTGRIGLPFEFERVCCSVGGELWSSVEDLRECKLVSLSCGCRHAECKIVSR